MFEKLIEYEQTLPQRFNNWAQQNPKHARIFPKIAIYMFICAILAGFVYTPLDFAIYTISLLILYFIIYFLPMDDLARFLSAQKLQNVIFLDRDGVINNDGIQCITDWSQFKFIPNAKTAIKLLTKNNFHIIVVTNQPIVSSNQITTRKLNSIHKRMKYEIRHSKGRILHVYHCPHSPDSTCSCRKPRPGLIQTAIKEYNIDTSTSYMIGDRESDILAGKNSNIKTILVLSGYLKNTNELPTKPDLIFKNLLEASKFIIEKDK